MSESATPATPRFEYDVFLSYARRDDAAGLITAIRDALYEDWRRFSQEPFSMFFDRTEIRSMQDWEHRLGVGLRTAQVLVVCASDTYFSREYCLWEWRRFTAHSTRRSAGADAIAGFSIAPPDDARSQPGAVGTPLSNLKPDEVSRWRAEVSRVQLELLGPHLVAPQAVDSEEFRAHIAKVGESIFEHLNRVRLTKQAPGNVGRRNRNFVGRSADLRRLAGNLTAHSAIGDITVLHGVGGMGKSELATAYAHTNMHRYQAGTWRIPAEGFTDILECLAQLAIGAPDLGVVPMDRTDTTAVAYQVLARLTALAAEAREREPSAADCLLIFDNVSEADLLSERELAKLPSHSWLHVIATTRLGPDEISDADAGGYVILQEVGRMEPDDALEAIRIRQPALDEHRSFPDFPDADHEAVAREIVGLLDGYTLAIEQAAVFLGSGVLEPHRLLEILRDDRGLTALDSAVGNDRLGRKIRHQTPLVGRILEQTLDAFPSRAIEALIFASLLPPIDIPWGWLEALTDTGDDEEPNPFAALLTARDDWTTSRRVLQGRSLITPGDLPDRGKLHRVLAAHLRARATPAHVEALGRHLARVTWTDALEPPLPDPALVHTVAVALAHVVRTQPTLITSAHRILGSRRAYLDLTTTDTLVDAVLDTARTAAEQAPENADAQRGLSIAISSKARQQAARGSIDEALALYEESRDISATLAGADPGHPDSALWRSDEADACDSIGRTLRSANRNRDALTTFAHALTIRERLITEDPNDAEWRRQRAISLDHLADTHRALGSSLDVVAPLHDEALQIREALVEQDHDNRTLVRELTISLENVARDKAAQHNTALALSHSRRALGLRIALAEESHNRELQSDLARSYENLAMIARQDPTATDTVADHLRHALEIREQLARADPDNPALARNLALAHDNLGRALLTTDLADGLRHLNAALNLRRDLADGQATPTTQFELAVSLYHVGIAQRRHTPQDHPHVLDEALQIMDQATASFPELRDNPRMLEFIRVLRSEIDRDRGTD